MRARSKPPHRRSKIDTKTRTGRRKPASGVSPRIGVISDTHGLIRPEALAALQGVDAILHAGDIGGQHVIEALSAIAPVTFVRGNNDDSDGYNVVHLTIGNQRILLTHIYRPELLQQGADIIVFGHSHQPHNEVIDGILFFNPGSAGPRRFDYPVSVGIIEAGRAYHVALDGRSKTRSRSASTP